MITLWILAALYAAARPLQTFPDKFPMLAIVALHVLPPALFALLHGAMRYRLRGILTFIALCLVVGNASENLSIATGFPFGHYYFTEVMGPKILSVPVLLGFAYIGMGYLSWTLARLIAGNLEHPLAGARVFTVPVLAGLIMVAWDLSMDPIWSTMLRAWIWIEGGSYYGVPVSNFLGWYLTVFVIYQLFAIYLRVRTQDRAADSEPLPSGYWQVAVFFYAISAIGNLAVIPSATGRIAVADPAGQLWKVHDILLASSLFSILVMGGFAVLAWRACARQSAA